MFFENIFIRLILNSFIIRLLLFYSIFLKNQKEVTTKETFLRVKVIENIYYTLLEGTQAISIRLINKDCEFRIFSKLAANFISLQRLTTI